MNINKYIARIGFNGELSVTLACLKKLHKCHVLSVPFEALDVTFKRRIDLDLSKIFDKVVVQQRGGYCYEVNYLFYSLLHALGFDCAMISASIYDNGAYGPAFDHMAIVVKLEEVWLADVGYGDLFLEPIKIQADVVQEDFSKNYQLKYLGENQFQLLESLKEEADFIPRYQLELSPKSIDDFIDQNNVKQDSPESYFVKNIVCTIATENGRKTIFNKVFKIKTEDRVEEREIMSQDDLLKILETEFTIRIEKK